MLSTDKDSKSVKVMS